jgi:hypothetical protein
MKGSTKVRLGMAAMALGAVAVAALPASAQSTGAAAIVGTGGISPGLTQGGDPGQTFTFGGDGAVATDTAQGSIHCTATGDDTVGSWSQGAGSFNGSCTGAANASVAGTYVRTGAIVTVTGTATGTGISGSFTGRCVFTPINVSVTTPPVPPIVRITQFSVTCTFTIP